MEGVMSADELDPLPEGLAEKLLGDRTEDEIINDTVASDPRRHSTPVMQRLLAARRTAGTVDMDEWEAIYRARIIEIGGDPDEFMPGNKPRYTVDEETGVVKDHETGAVHRSPSNAVVEAVVPPADGAPTDAARSVLAGNDAAQTENVAPKVCDHDFPEPVYPETPCKKCQMKFVDWANS
jgi:hypothetical protein